VSKDLISNRVKGSADEVRNPTFHSEAAEAKRKIVKSDNFTGQTNTVDVDKHM